MAIGMPRGIASHRLTLHAWQLVGMWLAIIMGVSPCRAADPIVKLDAVAVGFQGVTKVGEWAPLSFQVSGQPGQSFTSRITASDIEGRPVQIAGPIVTLTTAPQSVEAIYQQGPMNSPVVVELLQEGRVVAERATHPGEGLLTLTPLTDFVVCLGKSQPGFEAAAAQAEEIRENTPQRVPPLIVRTFTEDHFPSLPRDPRGWHAVDVCVLDASCRITPELGTTLRAWVMRGGRLLISGGPRIPVLEAGPVAAWSPIQSAGEVTLREVSAVNSVLPGSSTLRFREGSRSVAQLTSQYGVSLIPSQEAIVVRAGCGAGTVTVICLDLNDRPFVTPRGDVEWDPLPDLCRWLSGMRPIIKDTDSDGRPDTDLTPTGVSDLHTQLVNSIDAFPQVQRPNYWLVLGQCVLFLALVGAGDYYLVHKVIQRPHWTWGTLPLWIALGGYYGMSTARATTGRESLARQVDLLTIDAESQSARVDCWLTLYEPEHRRRAVGYSGDADSRPTLRWEGRPEAGFRGLYRETSLQHGEAITSLTWDSQQIESWPIRHGSTAVIVASQESVGPVQVKADLIDTGAGRLGGNLKIEGPGSIDEWVVAYGNLAYLSLAGQASEQDATPESLDIDLDRAPTRLLSDYVTGLRSKQLARREQRGPEYLMVLKAYDPLGNDLSSLFRTLTFHEVAGGSRYTTLTNASLRKEDFSHLIRAGRAVLLGRWRPPVSGPQSGWPGQFLVDQQPIDPPGRESFIRVILPVTPSGISRAGQRAAAP